VAYVDLNTIHNPATGTIPPASWGDQIRDNLESHEDPARTSVYHDTTQSKTSGTTLQALAANSEHYDTANQHSNVTTNSRITVAADGRYRLGAVLSWAASGTGNRATAFTVNGTDDYLVDIRTGTATNSTGISGSRTISLTAGDYVEVTVWQTSGGALLCTLDEFSVERTGR
jgi:hypothetical protein